MARRAAQQPQMMLTGLAIAGGAVLLVLLFMSHSIPLVTEAPAISEWQRGWNAAKYAIADQNSYARNAAMRVDDKLNACLGRGKVWSDRHRTCDD